MTTEVPKEPPHGSAPPGLYFVPEPIRPPPGAELVWVNVDVAERRELMVGMEKEKFVMGIQIVFETHSISEDNENGIATGWLHGRLSERGRLLASELGARRRDDGIQAVFTSDLGRAVETARIAFASGNIPVFADWRLRECDYGVLNGHAVAEVHENRLRYLYEPYPGGESWLQAIERVGRFLPDLRLRWENMRILVIGHRATQYAFEHQFKGITVEEQLISDFAWREGWEYNQPG